MSRKINILALYALADKDIMLDLLRHSEPLKEAFDLAFWHDNPIIPGEPSKTYFESRIHHTDIFLLLISKDLINTQFLEQNEFRAVIERHKENKAVVIPIIIDDCQWAIDLRLSDYEFNLGELEVLPEGGKAIENWDSSDEAYIQMVAGIGSIIAPFVAHLNQEESKEEIEKRAAGDASEAQKEANSVENEETDRIVEEEIGSKEKIDAAEAHRLREEAEAKRRAEFTKKIMDAAEASAKRRAEEDRLWEEAVNRRIAEKEKRIREEAELSANRTVEEKERLKREVETRKIIRKKKRHEETSEEVTILEGEQKKAYKKEKVIPNSGEENRRKLATVPNKKAEGVNRSKDIRLKSRLLKVSLAGVLAIAGIWAVSKFSTGSEEEKPISSEINSVDGRDSIALEKPINDPQNRLSNSTKLGVGDIYDGGIIFAIDHSNNTAKIAHLEDSGPMPWQDAANIHEQLGEGWRLPDFDELNLMYRTIGQGATNSGEFADELYWSATAYDEYQARLIRFWDGNTSYHYNKNVEHRKFKVRAIRDLKR